MRVSLLLTLTFIFLSGSHLFSEEVSLPRFPAIAPDAKTIAFSYRGDIWTCSINGGTALQITDDEAHDIRPVFSPDGAKIAFSSNKFGNYDVYVVPVGGSDPERITFHSADDFVTDWTGDGNQIVFHSHRDLQWYAHSFNVYTVRSTGGTPLPALTEFAENANFSKDRKTLYYNTTFIGNYRTGYRGEANYDIWSYNKKFENFSNSPHNEKWPVTSEEFVYFVSDEDGIFNIWRSLPDGSDKQQITRHTNDQVRHYDVSADGKIVIYEFQNRLYHWNEGDQPYPLTIEVENQDESDLVKTLTITDGITEYALSPDGRRVAFIVKGDLFVKDIADPEAKNVTNSPSREQNVFWHPERNRLYFISDKDGPANIYCTKSSFSEFDQVTFSETGVSAASISPDGKQIAYIEGSSILQNKNLKILDLDNLDAPILALNGMFMEKPYWSPDGKHIALAKIDDYLIFEIHLYSTATGESINVSVNTAYDTHPCWAPDSSAIFFLSNRDKESNDIWKVELMGDLKKAYTTARKITKDSGPERDFAISSDGKTIIYTSRSETGTHFYSISADGSNKKRVMEDAGSGSNLISTTDGSLYFLKSGVIHKASFESLEPAKIEFKGELQQNVFQENLYKFREGWQAVYDGFYDRSFRGKDWKELKEKYEPWFSQVSNDRDFDYLFSLMLGELNASHISITTRAKPVENQSKTGMTGIIFDSSFSGAGLDVKRTIPGSPAGKLADAIKPGDLISAVDGHPIYENTNIYELLENKVGKEVTISITRSGSTSTVKLIPSASIEDNAYEEWVETNRETVDKLSNNTLAYIHIKAMGTSYLKRFREQIFAESFGKNGLVLDLRYNYGGQVADKILETFLIPEHTRLFFSDGRVGYDNSRRPTFLWNKPVILLCNQFTYSNGEILTHAFKKLGLGTVVGVRTNGSVIATAGTSLKDGAFIALPSAAWRLNTPESPELELNGCIPDITIKNNPGDKKDLQLETAINELLKQLSK